MANKKNITNETIVKPVAKQIPETGIDIAKTLTDNILDAAVAGGLDLGSIDSLVQSAQNREQTYELIDAMSQDNTISAVLETYAEDVVQANDKGQIVWCESDNSDILDYVTWLLDSLNVDKHIFQWVYCLVAYGDVYLRLFRKSDVEDDLLFKSTNKNKKLNEDIYDNDIYKEPLTENVRLKVYSDNDRYIPYVKMVDNPGEMFDLQKFGKTHGYIKAPIRVIQYKSDENYNYLTHYNMKQKDVEIFDPTSFVHACLENTNQRQPETVNIYLDSYTKERKENLNTNINSDAFSDDTNDDSMTTSYSVKRGQSILYNVFKKWRELNLLELSALLNRLTKSSLVRILNVEVGDMPKEQITSFLERLKEKIEQKSAINTGNSMQDYSSAGPIDNTIYIPTHEGKGSISAQTLGGDFDPKSLVDLEYFRDQLFSGLKVPKQFFGITDDAAGFSGGSSLTIISSRYGKTIKRLQTAVCELVTDIVNLFLIDRGMQNYVNKFKIKMQPPVTQEEIDKRTNVDTRLRFISDLMGQMQDVEDKVVRLKIFRTLISAVVNDPEVLSYLNDYIDTVEDQENKDKAAKDESQSNLDNIQEEADLPSLDSLNTNEGLTQETFDNDTDKEILIETAEDNIEEESYLPSPAELSLNLLNDNVK